MAGADAVAQEPSAKPSGSTSEEVGAWKFNVAPYLWFARLDGNAKIGDTEADVDVSFTDILKDLSIGGMIYAEARKNRMGFFANPLFIRTGDKTKGNVDVEFVNDTALIAAGAFYRVAEWQTGTGAEGKPLSVWLEPYAGARLTYLRLEVDLSQGSGPTPGSALPQEDKSETWVDPIVGTRVGVDLSDNWSLFASGDAGGFGVGSDYSWNAQGYLAYRTIIFGKPSILAFGYRALHQNYDRNNFKWDVTQHGPILGSIFQF